MISITSALRLVDKRMGELGSEKVELARAEGRVLREDIIADTDLPPFDRSQMDGYAVIADDTADVPVKLKVAGESAAGHGWHRELTAGNAVRIMTGAPVPRGADAVQKVELTSEASGVVEIFKSAKPCQNVVRKGSEIKRGKRVFKSGDPIGQNNIAALASFGYARVLVSKQPRIAIMGTGSEIVEISKRPGRDQIRNSNSVMLNVLCRTVGAETDVLPIIADDIAALKAAVKQATKRSNILVMTGGVSVGRYDHTKTALRELGAEVYFDKVKLKPGKPVVFARLGRAHVFALPGNPVSAVVTFHLFVRKAILKMQGARQTNLRRGRAVLDADVKAARERDTFLPSRSATDASGRLIVSPLKWQGSSDLVGFAQADSMIFVPSGQTLKAGDVTEIAFL
jgi:molybdenum cofactor synthesis domain-containing protein